MLRINLSAVVLLCVTLLGCAAGILGQFFRKPWPTYSLQNMPETSFACQDKILGGYYADAETQCQMFHVCVKVAGVGVQDFRFLCPNGTAFDQESQICADWGDVDCDQSVLYYGSDNFDLYRLGSGFESKRAPLAEEEESTFHLQRAESGDIRRSKETRIDQKARPQQPPNYAKEYQGAARNSFRNHNSGQYNDNYSNNNNNNNNNNGNRNQLPAEEKKRPAVNYYAPAKTSTTTTTTTERYNDDSKQDFDEIFKGSHSSHFFANRNGGREDDFIDHPIKTKFNDFTEFNKKPETSTAGKTRNPPTKRVQQTVPTAASTTTKTTSRPTTTTSTTTTTTTTTTRAPKTTTRKQQSQQPNYSSDFYNYSPTNKPSTFPAPAPSSRNTKGTTARPSASSGNRFALNDYKTQEKIVPTTYNPANSVYRLKLTTPKYSEINRDSDIFGGSKANYNEKPSKSNNQQSASTRKPQKQKLGPRNSTFVNQNEFSEFSKIKLQPPQPFQPAKTTEITRVSKQKDDEQQYFVRSRGGQQVSQSRVGYQEPAPFSPPQQQPQQQSRGQSKNKKVSPTKAAAAARTAASRGSINYKATTQRAAEAPAPTVTSNESKKFPTQAPKDLYTPTTFKPSTYQKAAYDYNFYQTAQQQTVKPANQKPAQKPASTKLSTTAATTTANPYYNIDEDDGQYHPELYEVDFPRNRFNLQRSKATATPTTTTSTTSRPPTTKKVAYNFQNPQSHLKTQQQTAFQKQQEQAFAQDLSDEDEELFKTAQSLNFGAASINKLRADIFKAEKTSQQYNSQYSPNAPTTTTTKTTTTSSPPIEYTQTTRKPTTNYYAYTTAPTPTTVRAFTTTYVPTTTTTAVTARPTYATTTTRRPQTTTTTTASTTTQRYLPDVTKSGKKPTKSNKDKSKKGNKTSSKRPSNADEDTSYDYAYYDTDTLSESPQDYAEYEIAEFTKTRKN